MHATHIAQGAHSAERRGKNLESMRVKRLCVYRPYILHRATRKTITFKMVLLVAGLKSVDEKYLRKLKFEVGTSSTALNLRR